MRSRCSSLSSSSASRSPACPSPSCSTQPRCPAGARIETIALNDYRYADTVGQWVDNDALLAVLRDGELIPMDQGGPIRIVFAEDSPAYELLDAWNWSLRSIVVVD